MCDLGSLVVFNSKTFQDQRNPKLKESELNVLTHSFHRLNAPCTDCAAPYGFINHMALDLNADRFSERVNATRISGNLDAPEGEENF